MTSSVLDLNGKTAVVTGSRGRIGTVLSQTFTAMGANVIGVDLPGTIQTSVDGVLDIDGDVAEPSTWIRVADVASSTFKSVDIVVHAAALVGLSKLQGWSVPYEQQDPGLWAEVFDVNVTSIFGLLQKLTPLMKQRGASVVLISSIYGGMGPDLRIYEGTSLGNPAGYAASKGALEALTRWLATVLAPSVRVNAISLGGVYSGQDDEFVRRYSDRVPLRRMATVQDLVGPVVFLASASSSYVSGAVIPVDGGLSAW